MRQDHLQAPPMLDWKDKTSTSNRSVHKRVVPDANNLDATVKRHQVCVTASAVTFPRGSRLTQR
jgi:hypothetical protein